MIHNTQRTSSSQPLNVLVAEDGLVNRILAHGMLTREGCCVTLADNGARAVSALQQCRYDLVLMDVDMPIMDGLSATRAIRQYEEHSGQYTPVIALTSHANRDECLAAGMDAFLSKPLDLRDFRRVVADVLNRHAA
jgi:CheY-like chemotaxis protein